MKFDVAYYTPNGTFVTTSETPDDIDLDQELAKLHKVIRNSEFVIVPNGNKRALVSTDAITAVTVSKRD